MPRFEAFYFLGIRLDGVYGIISEGGTEEIFCHCLLSHDYSK